ncbi:MAG: DMT family transporter [Pseudomonadota bacterium]
MAEMENSPATGGTEAGRDLRADGSPRRDTPVDRAPPKSAPRADSQQRDNLRGASWMLVSVSAATVMMIAIRYLSGELDSRMIAFLRSALGMWVLLWAFADGSAFGLRFSRPWLHILRGALMGIATNLGFFAISTLTLATANILFFLAPVFATALAAPILGEAVGIRRWAAVLAGLLGAAIILRPGFTEVEWGMLAACGSAACFSVSLLLTRVMGADNAPKAVMISSVTVSAIVTFPIALPVWELPATSWAWVILVVLVLSSSLRQYSDIRAYSIGEAGFLAPFTYLRLVLVALAGWLLFREGLDVYTLLGGAVIIGATLYIAHREQRLNKRIAGLAA